MLTPLMRKCHLLDDILYFLPFFVGDSVVFSSFLRGTIVRLEDDEQAFCNSHETSDNLQKLQPLA